MPTFAHALITVAMWACLKFTQVQNFNQCVGTTLLVYAPETRFSEPRFSEPRFSEILNLMNKPQLPFSYFALYSDLN